jgi:hypothetical protein
MTLLARTNSNLPDRPTRLTTLPCKKITVAKSKEVKPGQIWQSLLRKSKVKKRLFCANDGKHSNKTLIA